MTSRTEILGKVKALPPLPATALKLMQVVNDPRSAVDEVVEAIKYDQAVTGQLLQICNSAYFGLARKVSSLNDAVLFLGTAKVMQLVLSIHATSLLSQEQAGYGIAPGMLWRHSVAVGLASTEIARRTDTPNPSSVFTAGLLHDIGKVVLNEHVAAEFEEIIRRVTEERLSFLEAEQQVLGFSHAQIGGDVAEAWQLPEATVRCIRYHHEPLALDPPDPIVDAVYLANCLCLLLGIGLGDDGLHYRADADVLTRNGLHEHDLEEIGAYMLVELKGVEQMFSGGSAVTQGSHAACR